MKVKWGAIVVAGRGKIGGHVASRNSAGAYFRTKVTPVNPSTSFQEEARNRLGTLSQNWRDLTEAQRTSWNSAVGDFAKTDIFGDLKNPTGFNLYQRLNNNLTVVGAANIDVAPLASEVLTETIGALVVDIGVGDAITIALADAVPAGTSIEIWATPALSQGKDFVKSEFRLVQVSPAATATPIDFQANYETRFGAPAEGGKVFCQIKYINNATGQASPVQKTSTTVISSV